MSLVCLGKMNLRTLKENKMRKKIKYLIDLERSLYPEVWKIKRNYININGEKPKRGENKYISDYDMLMMDDELDPYKVNINSEGLHIDTEDYTHISLTERHLDMLHGTLMEFKLEYLEDEKREKKELDKINNNE